MRRDAITNDKKATSLKPTLLYPVDTTSTFHLKVENKPQYASSDQKLVVH